MTNNFFPAVADGPLWIFTMDQTLNVEQVEDLNRRFLTFFSEWNAHGNQVRAAHMLMENRILFVVADGSSCDVTGCSKDKLYHFLKAVGTSYGVDFFNRMLIPVWHRDELKVVHWNDIESMVDHNELENSASYVDATIASVAQFRSTGLKPISSLLVNM
jgi:hypothetical protein